MARSSAAVKRSPAPKPSAPAGGFAPSGEPLPPPGRRRPAAIDLAAPRDDEVAVADERRRGRGAQ